MPSVYIVKQQEILSVAISSLRGVLRLENLVLLRYGILRMLYFEIERDLAEQM